MRNLPTQSIRLPFAATLFSVLSFCSGCSRRYADGSIAPWGALILILDVVALVNIFGKPWDIGKKLIWAAIVFFFPLGGLLLYYFFGRNSS